MPDTPRPDATSRDSQFSLTIEDAAARYAHAGHPRTLRTVQRYCASGHLECVKAQTMLGEKYYVEPSSVSRHLAQIEELMSLENRMLSRVVSRPAATSEIHNLRRDEVRHNTTTTPDTSPPVASSIATDQNSATMNSQEKHEHDDPRQPTTPGSDVSRPVATTDSGPSRHVAQLEKEVERLSEDKTFLRQQIATKDEQIAALLERDRETNFLVRGLQQMLSPLLGPARHDPPEQGSQASF